MPRYFFHIHDGSDFPDEVGTELPSDEAARNEAVRASSDAIHDLGIKFWTAEKWQMVVVDESGRTIAELDFKGTLN